MWVLQLMRRMWVLQLMRRMWVLKLMRCRAQCEASLARATMLPLSLYYTHTLPQAVVVTLFRLTVLLCAPPAQLGCSLKSGNHFCTLTR